MSRHRLDILPVVLSVPYFDKQIRRASDLIASSEHKEGGQHSGRDSPKRLPLLSKSTSFTERVWPLSVLSNSPVSQSQILTVESSLAEAMILYEGWKATRRTWSRWPVNVYAAGALGTQSVCRAARFAGDIETSSWRLALRFSRSMICGRPTLLSTARGVKATENVPSSGDGLRWSIFSRAGRYTWILGRGCGGPRLPRREI